jgi:DNA-binding response OmpR family regulator
MPFIATIRTAPIPTALRRRPPARPPLNPVPPKDRARLAEFARFLRALPETPTLHIDPTRHVVRVNGQRRHLTALQLELLVFLAARKGQVVTREELFATLWHGRDLEAASRTVDVHISRLRAKLAPGEVIVTARGRGYLLHPAVRVEGPDPIDKAA